MAPDSLQSLARRRQALIEHRRAQRAGGAIELAARGGDAAFERAIEPSAEIVHFLALRSE